MSGMPKWMWPLIAALYPMLAHATFHTWTIEAIYSSADGTVQFVMLHESQGFAAQDQWAGKTFTNTHAGLTKTFTFPANLPSSLTAGRGC
jgi:hypothetical protein